MTESEIIRKIYSILYDATYQTDNDLVFLAYTLARDYVREQCSKEYFKKVYCSQCGGEFGPGKHGYSHCADHVDKG